MSGVDERPRWRWPELIWPADRDTARALGDPVHLRGGRCAECEQCSFPFGASCDWCGAPVSEYRLPGEGAVAGHTEVMVGVPGSAIAAPYRVALVRLAGVGLDVLGPAQPGRPLAVDQPVRVITTQPFDTGELHYAFAPTTGEGA